MRTTLDKNFRASLIIPTPKNIQSISYDLTIPLSMLQTIMCEGQIESWLPLLLNGITASLQSQLAVVLGTEAPTDNKSKKSIRSAGSRKIVVHSSHGSRPGSKQKAAGI